MKVVLVDDDEVVLKSLGEFLTLCGHNVWTCASGATALLCMEEELPDVVINDIRMPEMNGLKLLEIVTARFTGVPVILITAHGDQDTAAAALKQGAYDYIRKPYDLDEVVAVLERIEERKRLGKMLVVERAKLAHAGRLAAVGALAAGMAHEINNGDGARDQQSGHHDPGESPDLPDALESG